MSSKRLYIETFGCQMNERDSEIMTQRMAEASYVETGEPSEADVIVINTCSIRGKAEQKAYSLLGRFRKLKEKRPGLVIAMAGCVAQQEGEKIRQRMPHIDLVFGPQSIYQLPELVTDVRQRQIPQTATGLSASFVIPPFLPELGAGSPHKRFVTIMQGCNNFCTYCVVPYTRGREISRKFEDILAEVSHLAAHGVKEITLLGQNVNSYGLDRQGGDRRSFSELLHAVAGVGGIERIRFTTSHPKDLSVELMRCFADIEKLCPHFHLPVQSGSDAVLKRMNRKYTVASYLEKVERLRQFRPDIALTTDIIVGFPGETDEDFEATMDLIETVRYHGAFSFKYSDRPHARSAGFADKVDEEIKSARLSRLQARQEEISLARKQEEIGKVLEVMIEGKSKSAGSQWSGRTTTNHIVNFEGPAGLVPGRMRQVVIEEACRNSLRGRLVF